MFKLSEGFRNKGCGTGEESGRSLARTLGRHMSHAPHSSIKFHLFEFEFISPRTTPSSERFLQRPFLLPGVVSSSTGEQRSRSHDRVGFFFGVQLFFFLAISFLNFAHTVDHAALAAAFLLKERRFRSEVPHNRISP